MGSVDSIGLRRPARGDGRHSRLVGPVGRPLDPPEDFPHATTDNASSAIVGFMT